MIDQLRVLGVMTGTSCDGLDAICVEIQDQTWKVLWSESRPYPKALRSKVVAAQESGQLSMAEIMALDRDLGTWYGQTLAKMIAQQKQKPQVIANHGQTVAHYPEKNKKGTTLQLGDPARIAYATGLTVTSHFRNGDLAAGGQGAPLAPMLHQILVKQILPDTDGVAVQNIGGIGNLTYLGPEDLVVAWDTGPGNCWIDSAVEHVTKGKQRFDKGGQLALKGVPDWEAIKKLLRHPYFKKKPPKTTGREDFPFKMLLDSTRSKGNDLIATATAFTLESMVFSFQSNILDWDLPLDFVLLCGGGAKNQRFVDGLQYRFQSIRVLTMEELKMDSQQVEPLAFALFGYLTLQGKTISGPWTGVKEFAPPGRITPGKNFNQLWS